MPANEGLVFSIFLIFTGAAVMATLAMFTRQSLLIGYIFLGMLLGPWGLKLVGDTHLVTRIGEVGIIFLLFLLGLHLHPQDLWHMFRKVTLIAVVSSLLFGTIGYIITWFFGYTHDEGMIVAAAMMFSSTIIGLKLLPTSILCRQHIGEVMIGILLMQDIIAIIVLMLLHAASTGGGLSWHDALVVSIALPSLMIFAFLFERYVLVKLLTRFDQMQEYVFLMAIGWCLGMAHLAHIIGLTEGIGAFIAGVAIAAGPIALYIAENLKPLRDFFLVLFFFSIGAGFNIHYLPKVIIPAVILAAAVLLLKPWLYSFLLRRSGETPELSKEVGVRLGQSSEFSILVAYLAAGATPALISNNANYLIQAMTILTFIVSCYWVVFRYPTPLGETGKLSEDK